MAGTVSIGNLLSNVGKAGTYAGVAAAGINGTNELLNQYNSLYQNSDITPDITFPSDLLNKTKQQYFMTFKFSTYTKPSITDAPILNNSSGIKLPIPARLSLDTRVRYNEASLGPAVGAALQSANLSDMVQKISSGDINNVNFNDVINSSKDLSGGIAAQAASSGLQNLGSKLGLGSALSQGLSIASGVAINPFLSVLFESPEFRRFNFNWKLMPRNNSESSALTQIIKTVQKNILPNISSGTGLFFQYPSIVEISINTPDNSVNLFSFKKAVIDHFTVNYAAGSAPAFFQNTSAPSDVEFNMSIREIEMWTSNDMGTAFESNISNYTASPTNVSGSGTLVGGV